MSKLIIIAGLPGSGKTHYIEGLKAKKKISGYYDDYQHKAFGYDHDPRLSRHYGPLLSKLKKGQTTAVSDILFCQEKYLDTFIVSVLSVLPQLEIELVFFENNSKKAVTNIKKRARERFIEKELKFVRENSPHYIVPKVKELEIYSEDKS